MKLSLDPRAKLLILVLVNVFIILEMAEQYQIKSLSLNRQEC
jgi:hypothetical protein